MHALVYESERGKRWEYIHPLKKQDGGALAAFHLLSLMVFSWKGKLEIKMCHSQDRLVE